MKLPDVIDAVRPSIVQITFTVLGLSEEERKALGVNQVFSRPLGTGFLVDDQAHVITAQHVIEGARAVAAGQYANAEVSFGIGLAYPNTENMRGNFHVVGFDVIEEDPRHDLALLRMRRNPFQGQAGGGIMLGDKPLEPLYAVPKLRVARPRDGDAITISGYPLGEPVLVTNTGIVASSWGVTVDQVPHPGIPDVTVPDVRDTYLGDVQTNPGNSGGPVYSSGDGAIVGVLVAGRLTAVVAGGQPVVINDTQVSADAGISLIVPAKYATDMLDRNGVIWTPASDF